VSPHSEWALFWLVIAIVVGVSIWLLMEAVL
jgi:hypothetical protein